MAKKKTTKKAAPVGRTKAVATSLDRAPRKEPYTVQRLTVIVEELREKAARLSGLSRGMEDAKLKEIVIDGHAMLLRGLNQIDNFADNAARALREARMAGREL